MQLTHVVQESTVTPILKTFLHTLLQINNLSKLAEPVDHIKILVQYQGPLVKLRFLGPGELLSLLT